MKDAPNNLHKTCNYLLKSRSGSGDRCYVRTVGIEIIEAEAMLVGQPVRPYRFR